MCARVCARIRHLHHEIANVHHLTSIQKTNYNLTATAAAVSDADANATVTTTTAATVVGDALFSIPFHSLCPNKLKTTRTFSVPTVPQTVCNVAERSKRYLGVCFHLFSHFEKLIPIPCE